LPEHASDILVYAARHDYPSILDIAAPLVVEKETLSETLSKLPPDTMLRWVREKYYCPFIDLMFMRSFRQNIMKLFIRNFRVYRWIPFPPLALSKVDSQPDSNRSISSCLSSLCCVRVLHCNTKFTSFFLFEWNIRYLCRISLASRQHNINAKKAATPQMLKKKEDKISPKSKEKKGDR
jgi:hypothetical protein